VGFGASSTFGGPIPTATMDRLAKNGLRYNNFHTAALSSPTRAALLSGRNHHSASTGVIMEMGSGFPGYNSLMPKKLRHVCRGAEAERLEHRLVRQESQFLIGTVVRPGPYDLWPTGLGFEYFYGFIGGDANQWAPALFEEHQTD